MSIDTRVVNILLGNKKNNKSSDFTTLFLKNASTEHSIRKRQRTVSKDVSLSGMWGSGFNINIHKEKKGTGIVFHLSHVHRGILSKATITGKYAKKYEYRVVEEDSPSKDLDVDIVNANILFDSIEFLGISNCSIHMTSNVLPPANVNLQAVVLAISNKGLECQNKYHLPQDTLNKNRRKTNGNVSGILIKRKHVVDYMKSLKGIRDRINNEKYKNNSFCSLVRKIDLFIVSVRGYGIGEKVIRPYSYFGARYALSIMLDLISKNRSVIEEFESVLMDIEKESLCLINKYDKKKIEDLGDGCVDIPSDIRVFNIENSDRKKICGGLNRF